MLKSSKISLNKKIYCWFSNKSLIAPSSSLSEINGLSYFSNYIDGYTANDFLNYIDSNPWVKEIRRRQQHYGYIYYHTTHNLKNLQPKNQPDTVLPLTKFSNLIERMKKEGIFFEEPNQCLVNEYIENQGISCHLEDKTAFGDVIACLTLGNGCYLTLKHIETKKEMKVFMEENSLIVLKDEARNDWKHGISKTKAIYDPRNGTIIKRNNCFRRVSLTFRSVLEGRKKVEFGESNFKKKFLEI